jgi:hypothetical protein
MRRAILLLAALVAGCGGGSASGSEQATLWVTRDGGAKVLVDARVPAGLTALQALDRETDVATRYGGRFVKSIAGLEGSLAAQRDWFYYVNGIRADRGAAEYKLRPDDVLWWDFRSWETGDEHPVVVGAFPEPFLHGFDGERRPAAVRYAEGLEEPAHTLAGVIRARTVMPLGTPVAREANLLELRHGPPRFVARPRRGATAVTEPVVFVLTAADRLARDPELARLRFEGLP